MTEPNADYPLSVFMEAVSGGAGKALLLVLTVLAALLTGSAMAVLIATHSIDIGSCFSVLLTYPFLIMSGFAHIWGIPIYLALALISIIYLGRDISHRWLLVIFLLQFLEAWRVWTSWTSGAR